MADKTIPIRVRLSPAVVELLKAEAAAKRWSVAGAAAIIIEDALAPKPAVGKTPSMTAKGKKRLDT